MCDEELENRDQGDVFIHDAADPPFFERQLNPSKPRAFMVMNNGSILGSIEEKLSAALLSVVAAAEMADLWRTMLIVDCSSSNELHQLRLNPNPHTF